MCLRREQVKVKVKREKINGPSCCRLPRDRNTSKGLDRDRKRKRKRESGAMSGRSEKRIAGILLLDESEPSIVFGLVGGGVGVEGGREDSRVEGRQESEEEEGNG